MVQGRSRTNDISALTAAAGIGVALGLFSHASSALPGGWRWSGNFGALWVLIAFLAGRFSTSTLKGASYGGIALISASVMHYVPHRMLREGFSVHAFRWPVVLWAGLGLIIGTAFGALGSEHKRGKHLPSLIGTASLVATFAGEAYVLYRTGHPRAVEVAVPIETATALIVPFVLLRSVRERAIAYVAASALVPIAVLGLSALMGVIHRVYPGID